jgi:glycosyltransferase involved in cell wall biosynthesis
MKLSPDLNILIPVYSEEKTIIEVLSKLNKVCKPIKNKSIIVIDDGSTDGTYKLHEKNTHSCN